MKRIQRKLAIAASSILVGLIASSPVLSQVNGACEPIWSAIQDRLNGIDCHTMNPGNACYGHQQLQIERSALAAAAEQPFAAPGDKAGLEQFTSISASPFNPDTGDYGIGVLKGEIERTIPGVAEDTSVMFILYGAATMMPSAQESVSPAIEENVAKTRQFSAFYFTTGGVGARRCVDASEETLPDGLFIESEDLPNDLHVQFDVNGASVTIGSTLFLEAQPNAEMIINVLEGSATVVVPGSPPQTATFMQRVRVPLGGANGLSASGAPSAPEPLDNSGVTNAIPVCQLATWAGSQSICATLANVQLAPNCVAYPNNSSFYLRGGPGLEYEPLGTAAAGISLSPVAQATSSQGEVWYQVDGYASGSAWIRNDMLNLGANCGSIPIAASIPPRPFVPIYTPIPVPTVPGTVIQPGVPDLTARVGLDECSSAGCNAIITVTNVGNAAVTQSFGVLVEVNGPLAASIAFQDLPFVQETYQQSISGLAAGESILLTQVITGRCYEVGCNVSVQVDNTQVVVESNEGNNGASTIVQPPVKLG